MVPAIGKVGGRLEEEDLLEVLVVLLVALVGLPYETEPHSPLIQKQLTLKHLLYVEDHPKVETSTNFSISTKMIIKY